MCKNLVLSVSALLVLAGFCVAQDPAANFPKPGKEHARLKELVGSWDAEMSMDGPNGKMTSKCTAVYKTVSGGMWIASDFEGSIGPQKFYGHGLDGYDATKKKYIGIWTDSMSTAPMILEGDFDKDGKELVMTGTAVGHDGKPEKVKTVTTSKDADHFTFKFYMVGADGKETPAFTIDYTRKK